MINTTIAAATTTTISQQLCNITTTNYLNNTTLCPNTTNTTITLTTTDNSSGLSADMTITDVAKIIMYICYAFIFIVGTFGNIFVIYVVGVKHRLVRSYDIHIVSLSIADCITAIFVPIVQIHDLVTNLEAWYLLGNIGCKFLMSINYITQLVSALTLVVISISRMRVIQRIRHVHHRRYVAFIQVAGIWCLAIGASIPLFLHYKHDSDYDICYDQWSDDYDQDSKSRFYYHTSYQVISCFLPIVTMVIVYTLAIYTLHQRKLPGDDKKMERKRAKQNRRIMAMFGYIVGIFFVLTTPYLIQVFIVTYYIAFDEMVYWQNLKLFFQLNYGLYTLATFNSCVNPFIYARMNQSVRKSLRHISSRWTTRSTFRTSYNSEQSIPNHTTQETFTNDTYEKE